MLTRLAPLIFVAAALGSIATSAPRGAPVVSSRNLEAAPLPQRYAIEIRYQAASSGTNPQGQLIAIATLTSTAPTTTTVEARLHKPENESVLATQIVLAPGETHNIEFVDDAWLTCAGEATCDEDYVLELAGPSTVTSTGSVSVEASVDGNDPDPTVFLDVVPL